MTSILPMAITAVGMPDHIEHKRVNVPIRTEVMSCGWTVSNKIKVPVQMDGDRTKSWFAGNRKFDFVGHVMHAYDIFAAETCYCSAARTWFTDHPSMNCPVFVADSMAVLLLDDGPAREQQLRHSQMSTIEFAIHRKEVWITIQSTDPSRCRIMAQFHTHNNGCRLFVCYKPEGSVIANS